MHSSWSCPGRGLKVDSIKTRIETHYKTCSRCREVNSLKVDSIKTRIETIRELLVALERVMSEG